MTPSMDSGRHFWIGLQPSPDLTDHDRRLLAELRPAGVVLFQPNLDQEAQYGAWLARLEELLADVRSAIGRRRILVGIDHEGGRVLRTPRPITRFPAARAWSAAAERVGAAMSEELASIGCNVDFAPVVDVDSNPANPVIGDRAFGSTPEEVIEAGRAFLRGLHRHRILGCLKHYPGHGDTRTDSHEELPVVEADEPTLRRRELAPFAALAGVAPLVMTAHVRFPAFDPELPATFSPRLLREVLRGEIGFRGVVASDDLGMRAVADRLDDPGTGVELMRAGVDLILLCAHLADTAKALDLARGIREAVGSGEVPAQIHEPAAERVDALLRAAPQHRPYRMTAARFEAHAGLLA